MFIQRACVEMTEAMYNCIYGILFREAGSKNIPCSNLINIELNNEF